MMSGLPCKTEVFKTENENFLDIQNIPEITGSINVEVDESAKKVEGKMIVSSVAHTLVTDSAPMAVEVSPGTVLLQLPITFHIKRQAHKHDDSTLNSSKNDIFKVMHTCNVIGGEIIYISVNCSTLELMA